MGSKVIRNVAKIRKVSTNTLAGRVTSGTGPAEELTATQARSLLSVYTTSQVDSALAGKVDSSSLSESIDDRVAALLVAGTNITITYNDAANTLTIAGTSSASSSLPSFVASTINGTYPTGILANDVIVVYQIHSTTPTLMSGFTNLGTDVVDLYYRASYKVATGTETGSLSGATTYCCVVFRNVDPVSIRWAFSTTLTNVISNSLLAVCGWSDGDAALGDTISAPTGWTRQSNSTPGSPGRAVITKDSLSAGGVSVATGVSVTGYSKGAFAVSIAASNGLSGTGSVDNAVLRADGTGGATLQSSAWIINDNLTASPNNTVNHASLQATGGTTNVSVSIVPKGTGAFCLSAPDGTTAGGNARGANAIDLCSTRASATAVASGDRSVVLGAGTASGQNSTAIQGGTASGTGSVIFGVGTASGTSAFAAAMTSGTVSGSQAVGFCRDGGVQSGTRSFSHGEVPGYGSGDVTGQNAVAFSGASATQSTTFSQGYYADATRYGQKSFASGSFSGNFGEAQAVTFIARRKTTDATPTTLMLDGASSRLTVVAGRVMLLTVLVTGVRSDGSQCACYIRKVAIKNVGGATSLVGAVETIGTDIEDNASTDITITADDTNDALQINVTGIAAQTWRWNANITGVEIAFGT